MKELTDTELERYARHIVLPQIGGAGQRKLNASRIAIVGAGAIGSASIPALAGAGVRYLTIIDDDVVELSNLHRQLIYREDQVGQGKADAAATFVTSLNSNVEAIAVPQRITDANATELLGGHDMVLDGSDNFATRLTINQASVELRVPLVSAAAAQFQGQLALFRGWQPDQPCYRCFVGDAFDTDDCDTCSELGVLGALTGTMGHLAALVSVRALLQMGSDVAGNLYLMDGMTFTWRSMKLPKDSSCKTCGGINAATS